MGILLLILRSDFPQVYSDQQQEINRILKTKGEVYRENTWRKTLRFIHFGKSYFLKVHSGVGWKEIFKNLFQFRLPVISAQTEWRALSSIRTLGIDTLTPVGFGSHGKNPARKQSFLITEDLGEFVTLEHFLLSFAHTGLRKPHDVRFKRALIRKVAIIARTMHHNGVNHRDFYLCHLCLPLWHLQNKNYENPGIHVMDLHRAQLRRHTPRRWVIKDLGALYFSSYDIGLTQRDFFRFMTAYENQSLPKVLSQGRKFWTCVMTKAKKIDIHHQRMMSKQKAKPAALPAN